MRTLSPNLCLKKICNFFLKIFILSTFNQNFTLVLRVKSYVFRGWKGQTWLMTKKKNVFLKRKSFGEARKSKKKKFLKWIFYTFNLYIWFNICTNKNWIVLFFIIYNIFIFKLHRSTLLLYVFIFQRRSLSWHNNENGGHGHCYYCWFVGLSVGQ